MDSKPAAQPPVRQTGFTLIECMISMVILTIGALGLLSVFGVAVKATAASQGDLIARQLASETIESIYTARNTAEISWSQIQNVSNGGIFIDGLKPVKCAGPDGILDTADDAACLEASGVTCPNGGVKCLTEPGADGLMGTADDVILSLTQLQPAGSDSALARRQRQSYSDFESGHGHHSVHDSQFDGSENLCHQRIRLGISLEGTPCSARIAQPGASHWWS